jgi:hypothetical protein
MGKSLARHQRLQQHKNNCFLVATDVFVPATLLLGSISHILMPWRQMVHRRRRWAPRAARRILLLLLAPLRPLLSYQRLRRLAMQTLLVLKNI